MNFKVSAGKSLFIVGAGHTRRASKHAAHKKAPSKTALFYAINREKLTASLKPPSDNIR